MKYKYMYIYLFFTSKGPSLKKKLFDRSNSLRKIDDDLNSPVYD